MDCGATPFGKFSLRHKRQICSHEGVRAGIGTYRKKARVWDATPSWPNSTCRGLSCANYTLQSGAWPYTLWIIWRYIGRWVEVKHRDFSPNWVIWSTTRTFAEYFIGHWPGAYFDGKNDWASKLAESKWRCLQFWSVRRHWGVSLAACLKFPNRMCLTACVVIIRKC